MPKELYRIILIFVSVASSSILSTSAVAQRGSSGSYYITVPANQIRPFQINPSRGEIYGRAIEQGYSTYRDTTGIRQWQIDRRNQWQFEQRQSERWLQQQQQRNQLQQYQQRGFIRPTANSTPMFMPPAPQQRQIRVQQQSNQLYYNRNQILQRWNLPPLQRSR